jgi:hypothetical protein
VRKVVKNKKVPQEGDPLAVLGVIDRLEVGPVELEHRKLKAAYRVTRDGQVHTMELIYRFQEDVFVPCDPESFNLASMIAAQVAVNYGLFCEEIVFHGLFDSRDRIFIEEMTRSTAREIFVKKFLEPNPFLTKAARGMTPPTGEGFLRAQIRFNNHGPNEKHGGDWDTSRATGWSGSPSRHAVLSSGGKDSLLTYGLLNEMGHEVHPIFLNESGRHWFTALNAYRYFARGC